MRPMQWSLTGSALIHVAILAAAIVVLPSPDEHAAKDVESIPVEIIDIEEISQRQAVSKEAEEEPEAKPAPPKIEQAEQVKPAPEAAREINEAAREPQAEPPLPAPEPLDELIEAAAEPELQPAPEPKPEPEQAKPVPLPKTKPQPPKRLAEKPKPQFNADELAALLNKIDDTTKAPPRSDDPAGQPAQADFDSMSGSDERLAADLVDALRRRIESCWAVPAGVRDAQDLMIKLKFALNPDGSLAAYPTVLNTNSHIAFDAAARSAQNAVKVCEPYDFLPVEKYELWRDIILTFDPSRILALN